MVRATGLVLAGTLLLAAAFYPGRVSDTWRPADALFAPGYVEAQAANPVRVYDYGFEPSRLVILAGQSVVWKNVGEDYHIVTPSSAAGVRIWKAAERRGTIVHRFPRVGRYPYYCSAHPQMRGVVVVRREL